MARWPVCTSQAQWVEWWAHCRLHCSGHQLHFDSDNEARSSFSLANSHVHHPRFRCPLQMPLILSRQADGRAIALLWNITIIVQGQGGVRNPVVSTVTYLSEEPIGGPTLVTDQLLTSHGLAAREGSAIDDAWRPEPPVPTHSPPHFFRRRRRAGSSSRNTTAWGCSTPGISTASFPGGAFRRRPEGAESPSWWESCLRDDSNPQSFFRQAACAIVAVSSHMIALPFSQPACFGEAWRGADDACADLNSHRICMACRWRSGEISSHAAAPTAHRGPPGFSPTRRRQSRNGRLCLPVRGSVRGLRCRSRLPVIC